MYPCKAIRRPDFMEEAIAAAAEKEEEGNNKKVSQYFEDENEDAPMLPYSAGNYMQLQAGTSIFEVCPPIAVFRVVPHYNFLFVSSVHYYTLCYIYFSFYSILFYFYL